LRFLKTAIDFEIQLKSGAIRPSAQGSTLKNNLIALQKNGHSHVFIQFTDAFSRQKFKTREAILRLAGIQLLSYLPLHTWEARIPLDFQKIKPMLPYLRWVGEISPLDKLEPDFLEQDGGAWALTEEGNIKLQLKFFTDVLLSENITR